MAGVIGEIRGIFDITRMPDVRRTRSLSLGPRESHVRRHEEVWGLLEPRDSLRALRFPESDPGAMEPFLDGAFHNIADLLRHGVPVTRERPPQVALVKQHRVRHMFRGDVAQRRKAFGRINLREPVNSVSHARWACQ